MSDDDDILSKKRKPGRREIAVISSKGRNLGPLDKKNITGSEVERGAEGAVSAYRARYARDIILLADPPVVTTDAIRYVIDGLREVPVGGFVDETEIEGMREYVTAAGDAAVEKLKRGRFDTEPLYMRARELYEYIASERSVSGDTPEQIQNIQYLELVREDGAKSQQFVAFGQSRSKELVEYARGVSTVVRQVRPIEPGDRVGIKSKEARPFMDMLKTLSSAHPYWDRNYDGEIVRSLNLAVLPAPDMRFDHTSSARLMYVATAVTRVGGVVHWIDASSGLIVHSALITPSLAMLPFVVLASFGVYEGPFDFLCKIAALIGMVATVVGLAGGGAIGSPTVIIALLAALAIAITIVAIGFKIADILLELVAGDDKAKAAVKKLEAIRKKLEKLQEGLGDGSVSADDVKDEMKDLVDDMKDALDDLGEAADGAGSDAETAADAAEALSDVLDAISGVLGG